jgi:hypothetical protein
MSDYYDWVPVAAKKPEGESDSSFSFAYLPFYSLIGLVKKVDGSGNETFYLMYPDFWEELTGKSAVIHDANDRARLNLEAGHVEPYLKFFCRFTKAGDGCFFIVESRDDTLLDDIRNRVDEEILGKIEPLKDEGSRPDGSYMRSGYVRYGDSLFWASFSIARGGEVEMCEDSLLWSGGK